MTDTTSATTDAPSQSILNHPRYRYYDYILGFTMIILIISNIGANKLIAFDTPWLTLWPVNGKLIFDGGAILFPLAYIFDDVLTEVYGYRLARRAAYAALAGLIIATLCIAIVVALPTSPDSTENASALSTLFGSGSQVIVASVTAFFVGSLSNDYVVAKLKVAMKGRQMWVRLVASTVVGEFFDTLVFTSFLAVVFHLSFSDFANYFVIGWVYKSLVEFVFLPLTYGVIRMLKRREGIDHFDYKGQTYFNPLGSYGAGLASWLKKKAAVPA